MVTRNRAAYMREYRAKSKDANADARRENVRYRLAELRTERDALAEEVARLKRELAARPIPAIGVAFNSRPFTPVPKPGGKR